MRVGLIASPFISVPPARYGGVELFIATLAEGLCDRGIEAVVYANGESTVKTERRWRYRDSEWPPADPLKGMMKELDQLSWAMQDAALDCDILHLNSSPGVTYSRFISCPVVCTLHHPMEDALTELYQHYPGVYYASISHHQASLHPTLDLEIIHHGLNFTKYKVGTDRREYLSFLGRIAPIKGTHIAIEVAKKSGIPLKIAGEIQPAFQEYYDSFVKPHIDGRFIEYVGEVDLAMKNELLGRSIGMLFPIAWDEPFGLVLIEAMACGTPVFAYPGGAVSEIVSPGISGEICSSVQDMACRIPMMKFDPSVVRQWAECRFSAEVMVDRYVRLYQKIMGEAGRTQELIAQVPVPGRMPIRVPNCVRIVDCSEVEQNDRRHRQSSVVTGVGKINQ
jgi:glycosyltransferase involved in cell wall biosynthesis